MTRTRPRPIPRPVRQRGFVLVIVLVLLSVLTLLAASVALSGSRAVAEAQQELDRLQGELDMVSTQETLLFMLATQRRNPGGMFALPSAALDARAIDDDDEGLLWQPQGNEIALDARPYRGLGHALFALQDDAGLLSLNWGVDALRHSFFNARGMGPDRWNEMDAKLMDYQDPDSLHRLGGAEEEDYRRAGMPPPANRPVATPLEFRRVLGWDRMLEGMDDTQLLRLITSQRELALNLNTAPPEILALIPGMDAAQAERLVALRRQQPIQAVWALRQSFPIPAFMDEGLRVFPKPSGNLMIWDRRFGKKRLAHWRLTPWSTSGRPWQIDYEVILPRDDESDNSMAEATASPLLAPEDPDRKGRQPPA